MKDTLKRDLIKSYFNQPFTEDNYDLLKECFNQPDIDKIDDWFNGVIGSLFWKPNTKLLVLCGKQATGKTSFLKELLPQRLVGTLFVQTSKLSDEIKFECLIADCTFFENKKSLSVITKQDFIITGLDLNKRLVSYATTCNDWSFSPRKSIIVINMDNFNMEKFWRIDKEQLWRQIYKNFKP